jgi:hypothetical protein
MKKTQSDHYRFMLVKERVFVQRRKQFLEQVCISNNDRTCTLFREHLFHTGPVFGNS